MSALSVEQAAERISCGRTYLYELIAKGRLPAKKLGKRTLILEKDVDAFLNGLERYEPKENGGGYGV